MILIYANAEVQPIPTFLDFGMKEFLVVDERGYECLLYKMAEEFLLTSEGKILDSRLKLNKVKYSSCCIYLFTFNQRNRMEFFPFLIINLNLPDHAMLLKQMMEKNKERGGTGRPVRREIWDVLFSKKKFVRISGFLENIHHL